MGRANELLGRNRRKFGGGGVQFWGGKRDVMFNICVIFEKGSSMFKKEDYNENLGGLR